MEGCEACSMQTLSHFNATATHMHQDLVGRNETQRNECVKSATVSDLYQSPTTCRARNFGLTSHVCLVSACRVFTAVAPIMQLDATSTSHGTRASKIKLNCHLSSQSENRGNRDNIYPGDIKFWLYGLVIKIICWDRSRPEVKKQKPYLYKPVPDLERMRLSEFKL